ncbi:DUF6062 family protein [Lentisphaerota bacterium ZTH]|nr:hypothetical protein JYG24_09405 [Lentisphaerota bacterium]WET06291.1 DUF6062 family protein [Lentisphaerota bacterium ZTH]
MLEFFRKRKMDKPGCIDMKEKLKTQEGCVLCHFENSAVEQYLRDLLCEKVNDLEVRKELLSGHGYCQCHASKLLEAGDSVGTATLYLEQLQSLICDLDIVYRKRNASELKAWLAHESCPVCKYLDKHSSNFLDYFVEGLRDEEFKDNLQAGSGLCLTHLILVLDNVSDKAQFAFIVKSHRRKYRELLMDIMEFIRKNDCRFKDENLGREKDSWQRAVKTMTRF